MSSHPDREVGSDDEAMAGYSGPAATPMSSTVCSVVSRSLSGRDRNWFAAGGNIGIGIAEGDRLHSAVLVDGELKGDGVVNLEEREEAGYDHEASMSRKMEGLNQLFFIYIKKKELFKRIGTVCLDLRDRQRCKSSGKLRRKGPVGYSCLMGNVGNKKGWIDGQEWIIVTKGA